MGSARSIRRDIGVISELWPSDRGVTYDDSTRTDIGVAIFPSRPVSPRKRGPNRILRYSRHAIGQ